ncbi:unnamed protein product, partial [Sphacelaria rigidula]
DYDGGDCCECTCVDSSWTCGVVGYTCIDPACSDEVIISSDSSDDDWWVASDDDDSSEEDQEQDSDSPDSNKTLYICLGAGGAGVGVLFCAVGACFFCARVKRIAISAPPAAPRVPPQADSTGAAVPISADDAPPPYGDPPACGAVTVPQA